ncbi:hypothetical protein [Paenibacillus mucilaginosus]|uniref:Uncharacterized protein n=1 Tax=Paenibacillus mucilaginosus (strain KNP414) TaxID=1036673 RepID=F8FEW9_PAEMK|nr:hypothetical protein [Paenibacillus mucilaginosus]AEI46204.1 hypothetical protein KNP414_07718 [Paenibacillus mucilaginosus KNP414]MCG7213666.1 hypothetical protein [Paenibacillus mucilaginosus]WDM27528.1 hypothetical protein KCX80_35165 [Paenibacillus mucilaginosus]
MKLPWKQAAAGLLLVSTLTLSVPPVWADAAAAPAGLSASYDLNGAASLQVKSLLQEKTASGWRIGAVVKLYNNSAVNVRVPDHEMRAKGADGNTFTLQPSAANVKTIPAYGFVELSYLLEIESQAPLSITDLLCIYVDWSVYPKTESVLADVPVGSLLWRGKDAAIEDPALLKGWGEAFTIPGTNSPLEFMPVSMHKQFTGQSPTYVVKLAVRNPGEYAETLPDFTLSGRSGSRSTLGTKVEGAPAEVNPGETKYISFAVTLEPEAQLDSLYVMTPESFLKQGQPAPLTYWTGRLAFQPQASQNYARLPVIKAGETIAVDPHSQAVNPQLGVTLQSLQWFENEGQQFKTAVAKIKFANGSTSPVPLPQLGAELVSGNGVPYSGTQLTSAVKEVLPGLGAVGTYTFAVPKSEEGSRFTLRLLEQQGQQLYRTPIAQLQTEVTGDELSTELLKFYPFEMKIDSWGISNMAMQNIVTKAFSYTYKLKMQLDIRTSDEVIADGAQPKLYMQIENLEGKILTSKTYPLTGDNRLANGIQSIYFESTNSDQLEYPITVKIYELVPTPLGDAKRLISVMKQ